MVSRFRKAPIAVKMIMLALLPLVASLVSLMVSVSSVRAEILTERSASTQHAVETAMAAVTYYGDREKAGAMTRQQAQAAAWPS